MNFKFKLEHSIFLINNEFWIIVFVMIGCSTLLGCKKSIEIDPPSTAITAAVVYSTNASAAAVMSGMYSRMMMPGTLSDGSGSIGYLGGLLADELTNFGTDPTTLSFYANSLSSVSPSGISNSYFWAEIYNELHVANSAIEGLANYSGTTPSMNRQLTGEAKFMRAFFHFYAASLYGDIPIITTSNYLTNEKLFRSPKNLVYQQVIQDLKDAQGLLSVKYLYPSGLVTLQKIRPNGGAATAVLARVYLYTGKWDSAETEATALINNSGSYGLDSNLNQVFLANSQEAIWQLAPVQPGYNTQDGYFYILTSPPGAGNFFEVALSNYLLDSFEIGDKRKENWIGIYTADSINYFYYPYKYKQAYNSANPVPVEYEMVFRLAEQYLIRAEARAQRSNIQGAIDDLNIIRKRAGLPMTTASDQTSVLTAILHERQVELFSEWGHRWFDLIRTGNINHIMGSPENICTFKGGSWNQDWTLMPLPEAELQIDHNLTQNPGYN